MSCCDFSFIAKTIYEQRRNTRISYARSQRSLIKILYAAYVRLVEQSATSMLIETEGDAMNACDEIYEWYSERYWDKKKTQNRGISKNVTYKNTYESPLSRISVYRKADGVQMRETKNLYGTYYFNEPYEKRQFEKYLVKPESPQRNEDFLAFILHTAVAFLLKPTELDAVLKEYGFQQLHVRNIHHLAIYITLSRYWQSPNSVDLLDIAKDNPFDHVKLLYDQARIAINEADPEEKRRVFQTDQTNWIREQLISAGVLRYDNYLDVIKDNVGSFTMRHKTILDDHHRFASIFRYLYSQPGDDYESSEKERDYSFYAFTNNFCCKHSEKKFREKIFDQIDKYGKHPTRELMICSWLYALCFAYVDGVYIEDSAYKGIARKLSQFDKSWAEGIERHFKHNYLDIVGFLYGKTLRKKTYFRGEDVVDVIREKLSNHYEWGTLDTRNGFDYYIDQLKYLEFGIDINGYPSDMKYNGQPVHFSTPCPDAVPSTIVVLFEFFKQLKLYEGYPLECNIYEQI